MSIRPESSTVIVDACGGADAPMDAVRAAARLSKTGGPHLILVGDAVDLQLRLSAIGYDPMRLRLVDSGVTCPPPGADHIARQEATRATLPIALALLAAGEGDALITASEAGVVLPLARAHLAALGPGAPVAAAAVFPTMPRSSSSDPLALLLDVSGETGATAEMLVGQARLGAVYSRVVSGIRQPQVALLSTGLEAGDGPAPVVAAHAALRQLPEVRFVGNLRATDLARGYADVVVTDGFTGHAVRGLLEGLTEMTVDAARYAWKARVTWRVGLRLLSKGVGVLRKVSEFKEYGGAPLLGLDGLVLIAAPDSGEAAFGNAMRLAAKCGRRDLLGQLRAAVAEGGHDS